MFSLLFVAYKIAQKVQEGLTYLHRPILILAAKNDEFNCTVTEAEQLYNLIDGYNKELVFYDWNSPEKMDTL